MNRRESLQLTSEEARDACKPPASIRMHMKDNTLYLLAIGNKQEQQEDIAFCKAYVKSLN